MFLFLNKNKFEDFVWSDIFWETFLIVEKNILLIGSVLGV